MTLPRLYALSEYWADSPPVNELLVAFAGGLKPKKENGAKVEITQGDIDLLNSLNQG